MTAPEALALDTLQLDTGPDPRNDRYLAPWPRCQWP